MTITLPANKKTAAVGVKLTATPTGFDPAPAANGYTYQWLRGNKVIPGATAKTYTLVADDAGRAIKVKVTASAKNYDPSPARTSAAVTVAKGQFTGGKATITLPAKKPIAVVGVKLTAAPDKFTPAPTGYTYQWLRNKVNIPGATKKTYTLTSVDAGKNITVAVTAKATKAFNAFTATSPLIKVAK